ncbi:Tfb4-domain-containing protein [Ascodesmis nigricans]|uniref:General transcription and DNA repair factor IIH subunit TFB4 n=1 Tax=Ascodesmis nigricans TaxID=341454 RepID=A0A4S2N4F1_9PEZI|nr:Tfb4-domain-containing protein [Ascodesmis nigricans]
MDRVDATARYTAVNGDDKPSLLVVILDTNPFAWSRLSDSLPLQTALSHVLLFINAHLAFSHANRVAVIASHTNSATFLYPTPPSPASPENPDGIDATEDLGDPYRDANKYRPFSQVETAVHKNLQRLLSSTTPDSLAFLTAHNGGGETMMAGALSLALTYISKTCSASSLMSDPVSGPAPGASLDPTNPSAGTGVGGGDMTGRIMVISVSGDLASQYVAVMNSIFAAQRARVPIDIAKISGDTVFLQQASDSTGGVYMQLERPQALLQYLLSCFMPDPATRRHLIPPNQVNVDFRAACFCHKRVVDIGFVCSICLSNRIKTTRNILHFTVLTHTSHTHIYDILPTPNHTTIDLQTPPLPHFSWPITLPKALTFFFKKKTTIQTIH